MNAGSSSRSLVNGVQRITPLSAYVAIIAAAGAAALVESLIALPRTPRPLECVLFAALAILTGSFSIKVVGVPARISVSDTFFLTIALLFGPSAAVITVALDSLMSSCRKGDSLLRLTFNTTAPALAMWAGSHAFFLWSRVAPFAQDDSSLIAVPAPLFCVTAIYFLLNSTLLAGAVALETRQRVWTFWHRHFRWLSVSYMASGSAAFCLVMLVHHLGAAAIAVILPVVAVFHITLRSSFGRLEDARRHLGDMDRLYLSTVETLAMAIDAKDDVTHSHVRRVQAYAVGLARELGVADEQSIKAIQAAALLHDTGKLAIPEHILNKPGKLNDAEFETMKLHVDVGADILSLVEFPYPVVPIVRCHHENWDGSGYPRGVAGDEIPIGARILSVVDCFDALTSDRPYRPAMSAEAAFEILRARSGVMYDPDVVDTFIRIQPAMAPEHTEAVTPHQVLDRISQTRRAAARADELAAASSAAVPDDVLAFVSLARMASGESSASDVLALASNLLRSVAANATAVWYVVDPTRSELVVAHAAGADAAPFRGLTMAIGSRVTGWVAANRQTIVNADPALDCRRPSDHALQSCLSVPLTMGDALIGVLTLYSSQAKAFTEDQGRLLQMIAPHVAQALSRTKRSGTDHQEKSHGLRLVSAR